MQPPKSILKAVFLSGFTPRRIALANRNASLPRAYLAHWVGLLLLCAVLLALYPLFRPQTPGDPLELWSTAVEAGPTAVLISLAVLVCVEIAFGLLALLLLPWGDARATVGTVWRHSLRTVWLHTGHAGVALLPLLLTYVLLAFLEHGYGYEPTEILPPAFAAGAAWYVAALLRAVTIKLPPAPARPPMCEACGYNLSYHRDPSARCPECGRPVALSLGNDLRGPVPWGPFAKANRHTGFFSAAQQAWFGPEPFFMGVSAYTGLWSAGSFLLMQMGLTAVSFTAAMTLGLAGVFGELPSSDLLDFLYFCGVASSIVSLLCGFGVCLAAAVIGLIVSKQEGRNCLGGTIRVACFCAGIVPVWVFCQVMALFVVGKIIESLVPRLFLVIPFTLLSLAALLIVLYTGGVARRVRYVRYANT